MSDKTLSIGELHDALTDRVRVGQRSLGFRLPANLQCLEWKSFNQLFDQMPMKAFEGERVACAGIAWLELREFPYHENEFSDYKPVLIALVASIISIAAEGITANNKFVVISPYAKIVSAMLDLTSKVYTPETDPSRGGRTLLRAIKDHILGDDPDRELSPADFFTCVNEFPQILGVFMRS